MPTWLKPRSGLPPIPSTTMASTMCSARAMTGAMQPPSVCGALVSTCTSPTAPCSRSTMVKHSQRPKCPDRRASSPPGDSEGTAMRIFLVWSLILSPFMIVW